MSPFIGYPLLAILIVLVLAATWITAKDHAKKTMRPYVITRTKPRKTQAVRLASPEPESEPVLAPLPLIDYPAPAAAKPVAQAPIRMSEWLRNNNIGEPYYMIQLPVSTGNDSGYGTPKGNDDGEFTHEHRTK